MHYVDGDVHFATGTTHLNGVTIVATGSIKINSTSVSLSPYSPDMPTLFAGEDRCNKSGIQFSASLINVSGALYSPDARIKMNSSILTATDASLTGAAVQLDGSKILVNLLPTL